MPLVKSGKKSVPAKSSGRLRIGDDWNAITIIALSQNNPLKAIAEFVENSIDAGARHVTIIRGKADGQTFLKIADDGHGIPKDEGGLPNFKYVATHICDSIKRRLKEEGLKGIQGEFGIGLLSFWTVGEALTLTSAGADGKTYQMKMRKGEPGYSIIPRRVLMPAQGTELMITPLLAGLRQMHGEKIQRYLASELRDRIRQTGVKVKIIDRLTRSEYIVEPRQFSGQLIHDLPSLSTPDGEIYPELYLNDEHAENQIGLYRLGTRVLPMITVLDEFQREPWTSGYFQGLIDVPFLNLTPGTRDGIIRDDRYERFSQALEPLRDHLNRLVEEQRKAHDERSSRLILRSVQNALKEAISNLPQEEYDWFDVPGKSAASSTEVPMSDRLDPVMVQEDAQDLKTDKSGQKQFFEFAGPLHTVKIAPVSSVVSVNGFKKFRAVCRDRRRRIVDQGLVFQWIVKEGQGTLDRYDTEIVAFQAPSEPCQSCLAVEVRQGENVLPSEAWVTVTDSLLSDVVVNSGIKKGLPGYTLRRAVGEIWRSQYDEANHLVVINNAHRDFVFASKHQARKLRYICRLFIKELVKLNFPGLSAEQLLERMIELSLYAEESLK